MKSGKESAVSIKEKMNKLVLPGFDGLPISEVISFVLKGFRKGVLVTRASSIAFNMLMALLPASIFLFTLIPFIPIHNFQKELIRLFENIMPSDAYTFLQTTIIDIVTRKSKGLLLIMFAATVLFSTNGIHAIIHAFVVSAHSFKSRSWLHQRKISVVLLMTVIFLVFSGGILIIYEKVAVNRLVEYHIINRTLVIDLLRFLKWIVIIVLVFLTISFLYYYAPAKRSGFRFFSAGSTLATFLFLITSLGFSAYVNKFGQYNKLYGSIGTLMVILIWLYLNSIAILIGFELNVSIMAAREKDSEKRLTQVRQPSFIDNHDGDD
jgi:membrane protein